MATSGLKALLLDLDDTLIRNPMDTFIPAYFKALESFVGEVMDPEHFVRQLLIATRTMDGNDGSGPTNEEVFAAAFYPALGVPREELEPLLARFYSEAFPRLAPLTRPRAAAPRAGSAASRPPTWSLPPAPSRPGHLSPASMRPASSTRKTAILP